MRALAGDNRTFKATVWAQLGLQPFSTRPVSPNRPHLLDRVRKISRQKVRELWMAGGRSFRLSSGNAGATDCGTADSIAGARDAEPDGRKVGERKSQNSMSPDALGGHGSPDRLSKECFCRESGIRRSALVSFAQTRPQSGGRSRGNRSVRRQTDRPPPFRPPAAAAPNPRRRECTMQAGLLLLPPIRRGRCHGFPRGNRTLRSHPRDAVLLAPWIR